MLLAAVAAAAVAAATATALWRLQNFLTSNKTLLYESPCDVTVVKQRSKRQERMRKRGGKERSQKQGAEP